MNNTISDAHQVAYQKIVEQEFPGLVKLLETRIDFKKWGFRQTFYGIAQEFAPSVIYDSQSCRVRFVWQIADHLDGPTLNIMYGRLHAPNHQRFMFWNGSYCHCWHNHLVDNVLSFLDGFSPQEAVEKNFEVSYFNQFAQQNKGHQWSHIEWTIRLHSSIWEHYGDRLFDLFDLHRPDLWEQYMFFVAEFYRLKPPAHNPSAPPPESIC
jgi:hypothetical protein